MKNQRKATTIFQILGIIALALVIAVSQVAPAFAQSGVYPLAGESSEAQNFSGTKLPAYNPVWTSDGRNWQPTLPAGPQRVAFAVAINIMPGEYVANGVVCDGYLDQERNGKGAVNKQVFNHENGKNFTVKTADGKAAWMLIQCDGGASSGYDIWATNPSYTGSNASVDATSTPTSTPLPTFTPSSTPTQPVVETPVTVTPSDAAPTATPTDNPLVIPVKVDAEVSTLGVMGWIIALLVAGMIAMAIALFRRPAATASVETPKKVIRRKPATKKSKTTKE